jgi:hypothetical protein
MIRLRTQMNKFLALLLLFLSASAHAFANDETPTPDPKLEVLEQKQKDLLQREQEILKQTIQQAAETPPPIAQKGKLTPKKSKTPTVTPTATPETTPTPDPLKEAQATIARLQKELNETKNRLSLSETEVERLVLLIDNRQKLQPNPKSQSSFNSKNPSGYNQGLRVRDPSEIQAKADSDMQIATVIAEKAQLRTGPGMSNSPLMTVAQGTRLAIEMQNGDWYRVIAPSGARAWVSRDVLDIGGNKNPSKNLTQQSLENDNGGFPTDAEMEAFKALQFNSTTK